MNEHTVLNYLETIANHNLMVNLSMHLVIMLTLAAMFGSKNAKLKSMGFHAGLSVLFLSVTISAVIFGNPFHAVTFGILAVTSLLHLCLGKRNIEISASRSKIAIACFFIFIGFWYPEFVEKNALMLLLVSPVGIIPCPTLLSTIGLMTLVSSGLSRSQYTLTIIIGFIYGIIGVFIFRVYLDIALLVLAIYSVYHCLSRFKRDQDIVVKL